MVKYLRSGEDFGAKHFADSKFGFTHSARGEGSAHMARGGQPKHHGKADKVVKSNAAQPANATAKAALGAFLLGQVHGAKQAARRLKGSAPPGSALQPPPAAPPAPMGGAPMAGGALGGGAMPGPPGGMAKGGSVKAFKPGGSKGKLHREMGIAEGTKIPAARLESATHSNDPEIRRDAIRAKTMKGWNHSRKKG